MRTYRGSDQAGYTDAVRSEPAHRRAVKHERIVEVEFATQTHPIATLEGEVCAHEGDAIVTGVDDERWPVSRRRFDRKYRPVAPTRAGEAGRYVTVPIEVLALRVAEPFIVELPDVPARLHGKPGDWLVDYGDGALGVVAADVFAATYDLTDRN